MSICFFVCACSRTEIKNFTCQIGTEYLNIALGVSVRGVLTDLMQHGTSISYLDPVPGTLILWYLSGIKSDSSHDECGFRTKK